MAYQAEQNYSYHDWKNYARKVINPIPAFKFPTASAPTAPPTLLNKTMETTTKILKDLITPIVSSPNQGSMTESNPVTEENILNTTLTDFIDLTLPPTFNESTASNNTVMTGIMETVTGTSITDLMQNGTIPIDTAQNDTMGSNNGGAILTTLSEIASSTVASTASVVTNVTEKAITFMNNATTESSVHDHESHYHYGMRPQRLLYVILFVIIAILILIGVMLLLIYIRYRKTSCRVLQSYYDITPMKERTPSEHGRDEQKQCPPEIYMHYQG